MNIEKPKTTTWAKLIALLPYSQNIALHTDQDEYLFDEKWRIYKDQDGYIFIKNLSVPCLHIDDNLLEIDKEKQLFGGERLSFEQDKKVSYIFSLVNLQSSLKRDREVSLASENLQKLAKIEADIQKELICPICTNYFEKCMTLAPCQHGFCSFCLFDHFRLSNKCPLCRVEAISVVENPRLSNVIQLVKENFSIRQRAHDRKELEEISFGGTIEWSKEGVYIGSFVDGLKEGQGKLIWSNGEVYEGNWKNGKREGKGVCINSDGDRYDGNWMSGYKHGTGKFIWSQGQEYEGHFQYDSLHGFGTMKSVNGKTYKGDWKNSQREGKGVCIYHNGDKYDGDWMKDCSQGVGKYTWADGREYEGDFQGGLRSGFGKMKFPDGRTCQGEWKNDKKVGHGTLTLPHGDKYEGRWVDGVCQPEVKVEYSNGEKYEGRIDFESLKKQGNGILILTNGDKYRGNWIQDRLQPQVTIEYANGDQYEGEINVENLQKHGKGVFTFKNGDQYDGDWMEDKQHGHGKEISLGGKFILKGVWEKGKISGEVFLTYEDDKRYQVEMKKLEVEDVTEALSENLDFDDSQTQDSDHDVVNESS